MTSKITPAAQARCAHKSMQEQLEDCRRAMQKESGSEDMKAVTEHLNHEISQQSMRIDGAD